MDHWLQLINPRRHSYSLNAHSCGDLRRGFGDESIITGRIGASN